MVGYYHKFYKNLADLALPLDNLQNNVKKHSATNFLVVLN